MAIMREVPEIGALIFSDILMQLVEEDRLTGEVVRNGAIIARMPVRRL